MSEAYSNCGSHQIDPYHGVKGRICPVTGGRETTMFAATFAQLCTLHQEREHAFWVKGVCTSCKGSTMPMELTLLNKAQASAAVRRYVPGTSTVLNKKK